jgi:hypothetical protein
MTQPKQASPKRGPPTPDRETGQARRAKLGEDSRPHQAPAQDDPPQRDASHQDMWLTGFIGRLAGLVRNIGDKK